MKDEIILISREDLQQLVEGSLRRVLNDGAKATEKGKTKHLTVKQASVLLDLAVQTIYGLTSRKEIPHIKKGKRLYFVEDDLIEWLNAGKQLPHIKTVFRKRYDKRF